MKSKTILEFIRDEAPKKCGYKDMEARNMGMVAAWVLREEARNPNFGNHDHFPSARRRAAGMMPYRSCKGKEKEYEECLDILEYAILKHRKEDNKEDLEPDRRMALGASLPKEAIQLSSGGLW